MKRLMQHKAFIYLGDSLARNREAIMNDLSELLSKDKGDVLNSEDVVVYDSKELLIDTWEEVNRNFLFPPTGEYKIIVFDNADELSILFQNKLLKPVEDAESDVKVIFNSTKNLLQTIVSRAMTIYVARETTLNFPKVEEELLKHFDVSEENKRGVFPSLVGIYKAIKEGKSLLIGSGLIKEKHPALEFLSNKISEIAELIILYEIEAMDVTRRSLVAMKYLETEKTDTNLYLFMLELEVKGGEL